MICDDRGVSAKGKRFVCDKCRKRKKIGSRVKYKGGVYCRICYAMVTGKLPIVNFESEGGNNCFKLEDVEMNIRNVNSFFTKNNNIRCVVSVPSCYAGKRVRVIVVEDEDED